MENRQADSVEEGSLVGGDPFRRLYPYGQKDTIDDEAMGRRKRHPEDRQQQTYRHLSLIDSSGKYTV